TLKNKIKWTFTVLLDSSVLHESSLGHLRYCLTDVPPQPISPTDVILNDDLLSTSPLASACRLQLHRSYALAQWYLLAGSQSSAHQHCQHSLRLIHYALPTSFIPSSFMPHRASSISHALGERTNPKRVCKLSLRLLTSGSFDGML
ncbi:hypothetical protein K437DRAFT_92493, partial [Tilletiaria anomala UBC 951]